MLGQTSRAVLRSAPRATLSRSSIPRRTFILSPAAGKRGTWKGAAARWALVIGGVYYYNTSNVFAEEPIKHDLQQRLNELPITHTEDENLITVEDIAAARKQRLAAASGPALLSNDAPSMSTDSAALSNATSQAAIQSASEPTEAGLGGPQDLEEEASQQGAFNEETGEINWECPCLGGMAHGPCGPEFREAFSCFVFSKEEPKGIDCIDRFKGMQDCFRQHPDIYGAELSDEEDPSMDELPDVPGSEASQPPPPDAAPAAARTAAPPSSNSSASTSSPTEGQAKNRADTTLSQDKAEARTQRPRAAKDQVARDQPEAGLVSDNAVPREWHDARGKNESK